MGGAEVIQQAQAAKAGFSSIVGHSGADLAQAMLLAEAETSVGATKDGPRLEQLASDESAAERLFVTTPTTAVPAAAVDDANTVVPVTGGGFEGAAFVLIEGAVPVVPTSVTDTGLSFEVPDAVNAGTFDITIVTPQGFVTVTDGLVVA
jgi:hypothetical protein